MNDNITQLLEYFKNKKLKNISEDFFLKIAFSLIEKHKNLFSSLDDVFEKFSLETITNEILNEIKIIESEEQFKLLNFKFNNKKKCCLAPYTTLNFDTMGHMRVCCYNNEFILGVYPQTDLKTVWSCTERQDFIKKLTNLDFPIGCSKCKKQIIENDISNSLFSGFDVYDDEEIDEKYPISLTFDFGTICNYECIMCGGMWSSSIRKNREKLPPIRSPYDDSFVEQLEYFLPKIKYCNFLGGEPFLNPIYYKIWDLILKKYPHIKIHITTNGSIFNSRIKNYFEKMSNITITVSLDSLNEETYQMIRKNGNFKNVMNNIEEFKRYKVFNGIAFCPMIQNVHELSDIILFCVKNNIMLGINDVHGHLGGKIKGIHENGIDVFTSNESKNIMDKTTNVNHILIPEVALKTLPKEKLKDIVRNLIFSRSTILKHLDLNNHHHYKLYQKYNSFISKMKYITEQKLE